ncbi:MAG: hypothetical protein ACT4PL_04350 [Phycisphaerales bacterium]
MPETPDTLFAWCGENGRVCRLPMRWSEIYELLPERRRVGNGWEPPLPLILAAWHGTPALLQMLRFQEHVQWASQKGAIDEVARYLRGLREDEWFHFGD